MANSNRSQVSAKRIMSVGYRDSTGSKQTDGHHESCTCRPCRKRREKLLAQQEQEVTDE